MLNKFPILYKRTTTGAIQIWQQEVDGNKYRTICGKKDGNLITSAWKSCKGKNLGRSNETTPEKQAIAEVEANYRKKLSGEYFENELDIDREEFVSPMLAHIYPGYINTVDKKYFSQPKLDGLRMIARRDGLWSRKGKLFTSIPHIMEAIRPLFEKHPNLILDGEGYNHEYRNDFGAISSHMRKKKPGKDHETIQFHIYDCVNTTLNFEDRINLVKDLINDPKHPLIIVDTQEVEDLDHLNKLYVQYITQGYEGQMIRANSPYEKKRSKNIWKRKEMQDREFKLLDITEGTGNWAGCARRGDFITDDNVRFGADIVGSLEQCANILKDKNKYIGKLATVTFFDYSPDGSPRFGKVKELDRQDV